MIMAARAWASFDPARIVVSMADDFMDYPCGSFETQSSRRTQSF